MTMSSESHQTDRFPPIKALGCLFDGETAAVVFPNGTIGWVCLPFLDDPGVFTALLGGEGQLRVAPVGVQWPVARRNVPGTSVLETEWRTQSGRLEVADALSWSPDGGADQVLIRKVICTSGKVEVEVDCKPIFDYDRVPACWRQVRVENGCHEAVAEWNGLDLKLRTDIAVEFRGPEVMARFTLKEGEGVYLALAWGRHQGPRSLQEAQDMLARTVRGWRNWLATGRIPDHRSAPYLELSAVILKGLCCWTGAIVAAPTTSLPEYIGGSRNWDYRYTWIRDGAMIAGTLYALGFTKEADNFIRFVESLLDRDGTLQIMYSIRGKAKLVQEDLPQLPGYADTSPVRIGNRAYTQRQNDVWGHILDLIYFTRRDRLDRSTWRMVLRLVECALQAWGTLDSGIWEVPEERRFTISEVYIWVAVDRGAKLAEIWGDLDRAQKWARDAEDIKSEILGRTVGVFTISPGDRALDASCLLIPALGFLPPDDPRVRRTVRAIAAELTRDGLLLRYRTNQVDDGLVSEEGAFVICSFWQVIAFALIGEIERAERLFDKLLIYAGDLGVYSEEVDPITGDHLGNAYQGFSQVGLIQAALALINAKAIKAEES